MPLIAYASTPVTVTATFLGADGPAPLDELTCQVVSAVDEVVATIGYAATGAPGEYTATWVPATNIPLGLYRIVWTATVDGVSEVAVDMVELRSQPASDALVLYPGHRHTFRVRWVRPDGAAFDPQGVLVAIESPAGLQETLDALSTGQVGEYVAYYTPPLGLPEGPYWVTWAATDGAYEDSRAQSFILSSERLIVTPERVFGALAGLGQSMSAFQRERIVEKLLRAQADLMSIINREPFATFRTVYEVVPLLGGDFDDWRTWPALGDFDDWVKVLDVRPSPTVPGAYDLDIMLGVDGLNEAPIVSYVLDGAIDLLRNDQTSGFYDQRPVQSVSAEGQSVSYMQAAGGSGPRGQAGRRPDRETLARYIRHGIGRSRRPSDSLWPNYR